MAKPPTAVTSTSIRPWRSSVRVASAAMAASLPTSQRSSISRLRAGASTEACSRSRSCSTIQGTHTTAPSAEEAVGDRLPRAPLPPVTRATRGH
jgi:hypothetical protein